jgi:deoxyribodipyrimidine photo-lyase
LFFVLFFIIGELDWFSSVYIKNCIMDFPNEKVGLVWFRQDLRLHDNESVTHALKLCTDLYFIYVIDPRLFNGVSHHGFPKLGVHRKQFLIESLQDIKSQLKAKGGDLIIRHGHPESVIPDVARQIKASFVTCNRERTPEELEVQEKLETNLWSFGIELYFNRGKMLFYTQDLPFPITHTPETFTNFKKEVERIVPVREPLDTNLELHPGTKVIVSEDLPNISLNPKPRFRGGEQAGLERLQYYINDSKLIATYKETRNNLYGDDYSSKFSPWLASGCLSPKLIYHQIKAFEAENGENESTGHLIFELFWRDYFRLIAKKWGNRIFLKGGIRDRPDHSALNDRVAFNRWANGTTGTPFIDANMRELNATGFMSNRGRQVVASYLIKDLGINWQLGAEYFESQLIDYDVASNWGNWNYIAGIGNDPREDRYFNVINQSKRHDPDGQFLRQWLPELENIPTQWQHVPDQWPDLAENSFWAKPLVASSHW